MSESVAINPSSSKAEKYQELLPQLESLIEGEADLIASLANVAAVLKTVFDFWWVGFYLIKEEELVLGPFQGPLACSRIALGKGVCGKAASSKTTIVVEDVNNFEGHIACSALSQSEIVVPLFNQANSLVGVLDVDSEKLAHFDELDQKYLERLGLILKKLDWDA
jgi:GAF domain-containing protein